MSLANSFFRGTSGTIPWAVHGSKHVESEITSGFLRQCTKKEGLNFEPSFLSTTFLEHTDQQNKHAGLLSHEVGALFVALAIPFENYMDWFLEDTVWYEYIFLPVMELKVVSQVY